MESFALQQNEGEICLIKWSNVHPMNCASAGWWLPIRSLLSSGETGKGGIEKEGTTSAVMLHKADSHPTTILGFPIVCHCCEPFFSDHFMFPKLAFVDLQAEKLHAANEALTAEVEKLKAKSAEKEAAWVAKEATLLKLEAAEKQTSQKVPSGQGTCLNIALTELCETMN